MPLVVKVLLEAMSNLESSKLSYLQHHTSDVGGSLNVTGDQLESARVAAAKGSPLWQSIRSLASLSHPLS